ncbi:hypothetical protein E8E14_005207 [Neopestalotiopsis sp. 37M]|nr:hypothetical protein E8E14_005207 [Neopestalotiopsis sp. 37M]
MSAPAPSLEVNGTFTYGDWRDGFFKDGYTILKNVIPADRALYYRTKMLDWLSSFGNGFDIDDPSTHTLDHLPINFKSMYLNYCAAHEKFMWEARTEPGVIKPFEELWGTDELLVSFDAFNVTLPQQKYLDFTPWPHVDQSHERQGLACAQGLLNLGRAGPEDGGLLLMEGSSMLFEEFFKTFPPAEGDVDKTRQYDFFGFKEEHVKWFESRGCHLKKICVDPGDLIIWDSRTLHYVRLPEKDAPVRTVIYACYTPRALATESDLKLKAELFHRFEGTTHWPHCNIFGHGKAKRNGQVCHLERDEPLEKPVVTDKILRLAGVKPYPPKNISVPEAATDASVAKSSILA